jgi:hypothetical protein
MISPRRFLASSVAIASAALVAGAQRDGKVYKIGVLRASRVPEAVLADALRLGLRERS